MINEKCLKGDCHEMIYWKVQNLKIVKDVRRKEER